MKKILLPAFILLLILPFHRTFPQNNNNSPKLVVGIVVDQMRYDYIYRFNSLYKKDGFNKLMREGSNFTYAHYNYVPTYTGPGHTSIYTGTTPYFHGIISNDWYDKKAKKVIYCTSDISVQTVGANDKHGQESPKRLLATTITDQLKLATNGKSKVIAISIKDRASILPGGHTPDAAYWYDPENGHFITSTFYMKVLPGWVKNFNGKDLAQKYMKDSWQLSYPLEKYENTLPDQQPFEVDVFKESDKSFPHIFKNLTEKQKYDKICSTPYGNEILYQFVKSAIENEKLGQHNYPDFLAVSFSSTDYIGHAYGPNSVEIEDTYIKLDDIISRLLKELDAKVGKGNYVLFLTGDHAVAENPHYLNERNIPAGWFNPSNLRDALIKFSEEKFNGVNLLKSLSNKQVFLNYEVAKENNIDLSLARKTFVNYLRNNFPEISQIYTKDQLEGMTASRTNPNLILNGFNPARSGDVAFELQPAFQWGSGRDATTHGSIYNYDTHVPLLFYGWHVPAKTINSPVYIVDIAPTIANLLKIQEPNACMGIPIIPEK